MERSRGVVAVAAMAAAGLAVVAYKLAHALPKENEDALPRPPASKLNTMVPLGCAEHDVRRKAALCLTRAIDHTGNVEIVQGEGST